MEQGQSHVSYKPTQQLQRERNEVGTRQSPTASNVMVVFGRSNSNRLAEGRPLGNWRLELVISQVAS